MRGLLLSTFRVISWSCHNVSVVVVSSDFPQVSINLHNLQGMLNWLLYLIYTCRLSFCCSCLDIFRSVLLAQISYFFSLFLPCLSLDMDTTMRIIYLCRLNEGFGLKFSEVTWISRYLHTAWEQQLKCSDANIKEEDIK